MADVIINWFEIPVRDLERAAAFYGAVLETELVPMDGPTGPIRCFQSDGRPIGALVPGADGTPAQDGVGLYFRTDDIDAALERAREAGGEVLLAKTSIDPYGHIGRFTDTEGNRLALHTP